MVNQSTNINDAPDTWASEKTLGGKSKAFRWKLDDTANLHIDRLFEAGSGSIRFTAEQIDQITDYVAQHCEVILGNSRSKLADGTEEDGLGKFISETLNLGISYAMAASQLGALFKEAGIWQWNERKRGMMFKIIHTNWRYYLRGYYDLMMNNKATGRSED